MARRYFKKPGCSYGLRNRAADLKKKKLYLIFCLFGQCGV